MRQINKSSLVRLTHLTPLQAFLLAKLGGNPHRVRVEALSFNAAANDFLGQGGATEKNHDEDSFGKHDDDDLSEAKGKFFFLRI